MSLPFPDTYLANALRDDLQFKKMTVRHRKIGELVLPTGELVACDPLVCPEAKPFDLLLPRGAFPVVLSVASLGTDQRVAYATVQFCPGAPVDWEMLTVENQDVSSLKPGEVFGYGVDAGTGCFMDRATARLLDERMRGKDMFFEAIIAEMEKTYVHTWSWCEMRFGEGNLIAFSSGYGDGVYATYVGRNAEGDVAVVVTDFGVAPEVDADGNEKEPVPLPSAPNVMPSVAPAKSEPARGWWQRVSGGLFGSGRR